MVNPDAGGGRAREVLPDLKELIKQRGWNVLIQETQSREDLASHAQSAAKDGRQRLLVLGGDGTFQVLLNAVAGHPETILGVIPAGGGNDLAAALGLSNDPLRAAALLLDGEVGYLDAARVRTGDGKERLYTGGGGVGLDAEAARYASGAYRNLRGRRRYLLSAIRALLGFHPLTVRVEILGTEAQDLEAKVLLAAVLNTPTYGGGVCLAPDAELNDGKLDLVLLEDLRAGEILRLLPVLATHGKLHTERVRRIRVQRVRIGTNTPCWFHGDGELLGKTPVEISVVPRAVRILQPRRKVES